MQKEFAEELDKILTEGCKNNRRAEVHNYLFNPSTLGKQFEKDGFGNWIGGNEYNINSRGCDFLKMGGYKQKYEEEERKNENYKQSAILTRRQITDSKINRWLTGLLIISILLNIIFGYILGKC